MTAGTTVGVTCASIQALGMATMLDTARQAQQLGYGSVWTAETTGPEAFATLAAIAGAAPEVDLGTGVLALQLRTPMLAAMGAATVQSLRPEADVLLVNPVRDGLNLVAKEGPLLNEADGVLVLSHLAGAWEELALGGGGALGINPFDVAGTADALHAALSMDAPQRAARAAALHTAVRGRTAADWWADQLAAVQR